ncbi:hypothetical protein BJ944DRAFT_264982 [Cunninghamella echinulata]|nr:hypothetical protein BJ944DRAFT_264982 [Cunninghamella echinulata]
MSPSIVSTDEPTTTIVPNDDDVQLQKWIKQIEDAEHLMEELEAKTEKLDAKMDELLANLDMSKDNSIKDNQVDSKDSKDDN